MDKFSEMIKSYGLDPAVFNVIDKIPPASQFYDLHIIDKNKSAKAEPEFKAKIVIEGDIIKNYVIPASKYFH